MADQIDLEDIAEIVQTAEYNLASMLARTEGRHFTGVTATKMARFRRLVEDAIGKLGNAHEIVDIDEEG